MWSFFTILSPTAGKITSNVFYQLAGKIVSAGASFVIMLFFARLFGPFGYGDIVKVVTFVSGFFIIADFGFNAIYVSDSQNPHALSSLIILRCVWSIILLVVAYASLYVLPLGVGDGYTQAVRLGIVLYAPTIIFQSVITTANAVFQKHLRYDYSFFALCVGSLVGLTMTYFFSLTRLPSPFVGAGVYGIASFVTAVSAFLFMQNLEKISFVYDRVYIHKLFLKSLPIGVTLVANLIYAHADSLVITLTRSTTEVGTYGFAYRIFETILIVPTFIMNAAYPVLLDSIKVKDNVFGPRARKLTVFLFCTAIFIAAAVWFATPVFAFLRSDFLISITYLRVLVLSLPIFFLSSFVMWMLFLFRKSWTLAIVYVLAMVTNIVANTIFVPYYGAIASAWITVVSETLVLGATSFVLWRVWRMYIIQHE